MKIFPAIDLRDGKAVRLTRGDYDCMTVYSDDPVSVAKSFYEAGARYLHIVDLDGAKDGTTANFDTIKRIVAATGMYCEVGGGIRDEERIKGYLNMGAGRVILGTAAVNDPEFLKLAVEKYGDKIAVGVDADNGYVAVNGWKEITKVKGIDFCRKLKTIGVKSVIYTDIAKDGGLSGTNLELYKTLVGQDVPAITASGGITDLQEIVTLDKMGIDSAILGKALYAGKLNLKSVIDQIGGQE
ncbi:MAG: 1-(5-phosphoribosyl)-5-[(5-phosphoribosylamino)methylideneamino]imidazole-4-carboxamide isomerase [Ruminococcaceae bacterium]|nr:1-(5-phosphoribosyl)-5-[(5-phosphoribosylamino)methylideneamino]imidazole-4-carboxamide isomerase [Oscillospiraceae bacterium]